MTLLGQFNKWWPGRRPGYIAVWQPLYDKAGNQIGSIKTGYRKPKGTEIRQAMVR